MGNEYKARIVSEEGRRILADACDSIDISPDCHGRFCGLCSLFSRLYEETGPCWWSRPQLGCRV
ncbi:hypothetical protein BaRGS_00023971, partial [Batillaria attramentaria]